MLWLVLQNKAVFKECKSKNTELCSKRIYLISTQISKIQHVMAELQIIHGLRLKENLSQPEYENKSCSDYVSDRIL